VGVDYQGLQFLLFAKRAGVSFKLSVMFGRQNFTALSLADAAYLFKHFGWAVEQETLEKWVAGSYIEPLLEMLGARESASVDASAYEGATIIHDMNEPLPNEMKNRFSVAIDFGTSEHVFNYPQALKNAMESVAVGGHFLGVLPCNGWTGHGFYQFSPELFFRALAPENGFELEDQYMCQSVNQSSNGAEWYRCVDPKLLNRRAEIVTNCPAYLLVKAKRIEICDVFSSMPQQSDYAVMWGRGTCAPVHPLLPLWRRLIPKPVKRSARWLLTARKQWVGRLKIRDSIAFQPLDE
jgi:hypothetical protein